MVNFVELNEWVGFIAGAIMTIGTAYLYLKNKGLVIFSSQKIEDGRAKIKDGLEKIDSLTADCAVVQDVKAAAGNISTEELGNIITFAATHANKDGGYTMKDAEETGKMLIEAAKTN